MTPNHFFYPIPDIDALDAEVWETESGLVGLNMNEKEQLRLLNDVFPKYKREYTFPKDKTTVPYKYFLRNGSFGSIDAEVLHSMIRYFKPKKIIEIGSGYSTYVSAQACLLNMEKDDVKTQLIAVEPYPSGILKKGFPGLTELIEKPLEKVNPKIFAGLGENDFLFIDSTHVLKIGGDVKYLYLEVLPSLAGGVIVHSHDIFFPGEYPKSWVMDYHWFWSEQYLLQAFLAFNNEFEVLWASQYMNRKYPEDLARIFTSYHNDAYPGSLWIKRKKAPLNTQNQKGSVN